MTVEIPGYKRGAAEVASSPLSDEEFEQLKQAILFDEDDVRYLTLSGEVLEDQVEDVLDVWYGFVASHPHLVLYFSHRDTGEPIPEYLAAVRRRFGQWIRDTAGARYDREWLDYQQEIAIRHHRAKKNQTDGADAVEHIPLRYLIAFIYPITATLKPFLAKGGQSDDDVERMHDAWRKSVILQVALWSQPYAGGDF